MITSLNRVVDSFQAIEFTEDDKEIIDAVLVPKIMGDATGLNPAIILLSLSIWGALLGILGMIIALPITTLIVSYYEFYLLEKGVTLEEEVKDE